MNDEETRHKFEAIERKIDAIERLVRIGMPVITSLDTKINALIDSHARLYDSMLQLAEAQTATERSLKTLIETLTHRNGH
jgi:hypothetical protein